MSKRVVFVLLLALLICSQLRTNAQTPAPRWAVMGDSSSDEYRGTNPLGDANDYVWTEIAVNTNRFTLGLWGSYGEPRRNGYARNCARYAAVAQNLITQGQITCVTSQIASAETVYIGIGVNDFAPYTSPGGYADIYNGILAGSALTTKINSIVSYITQAVDNVLTAKPTARIVLATIPDWNNNPALWQQFPDSNGRALVSNAIATTNNALIAMAAGRGIAVHNNADYAQSLLSRVSNGVITINDTFAVTVFQACNQPQCGLLADGIHPGTIMGALYLNGVLTSYNVRYDPDLPLLSEAEILQAAGVSVPPTATPTASATVVQTAAPTSVSTFTPVPTVTPLPSNTPTATPLPPTATFTAVPTSTDIPTLTPEPPTSLPPTAEPPTATPEPTFTLTPPPCSTGNLAITVNALYSVSVNKRIKWVGRLRIVNAPETSDLYAGSVMIADRSLVVMPVTSGLLAVTVWFTDDTAVELCFAAS